MRAFSNLLLLILESLCVYRALPEDLIFKLSSSTLLIRSLGLMHESSINLFNARGAINWLLSQMLLSGRWLWTDFKRFLPSQIFQYSHLLQALKQSLRSAFIRLFGWHSARSKKFRNWKVAPDASRIFNHGASDRRFKGRRSVLRSLSSAGCLCYGVPGILAKWPR